jgi:hypothetical protein
MYILNLSIDSKTKKRNDIYKSINNENFTKSKNNESRKTQLQQIIIFVNDLI